MGKLRQRVRHPALPGTPRAKAGLATACSARDAKAREQRARIRLNRRKTTLKNPE